MITQIINFDIKRDSHITITAKQGDINSRYLEFRLLDDTLPFSLVGRTVRAYIEKPDKKSVFNNLEITSPTQGYCLLELTSQTLVLSGQAKLELIIYESGKKLSTIPIKMNIIKSVNNTSAIESSDEFGVLDDALFKIDTFRNEMDSFNSQLEQINQQYKNYKTLNILDFKEKSEEYFNNAYDRVLQFVNQLGGYYKLKFPSGEFIFSNYTISVDSSKLFIEGEYLTILKSINLTTNKNFVEIFNTFTGIQAWDFMRKPISNLRIEGNYFLQNDLQTDNRVGLAYKNNGVSTKSSPHEVIENIVVEGFNIGLYSSFGAFKQGFYNCSFIMNDVGILFDESSGYACVPLHFYNCYLEANTLAIRLNNKGTGQVHFIGGSMEYNAKIVETYDNISFRDMHIEFDLRMANKAPFIVYGDDEKAKISIYNCWFLTLPNGESNLANYYKPAIYTPPQNLFEINISNEYYLGCYALYIENSNFNISKDSSISSNELIGGTGKKHYRFFGRLDGTFSGNKIMISESQNLWYNQNFSTTNQYVQFKDILLTNSTGTQTKADGTGTNVLMSFLNNEFIIDKNTGNCEVSFLIKKDSYRNNYIINLSNKFNNVFNGSANIDIYQLKGEVYSDYKLLATKKKLLARVPISNKSTYETNRLKINNIDEYCNYLMITINLNGITDSNVKCYLNSLIVNGF